MRSFRQRRAAIVVIFMAHADARLHNVYVIELTGASQSLSEKLFPLLKLAVNDYLNLLIEDGFMIGRNVKLTEGTGITPIF